MNMNRNILLVAIVVAVFLSLVGWYWHKNYVLYHDSTMRVQKYLDSKSFYISGKMLTKTWLYNYGSEYKDVYLIQMSVDTISLIDNSVGSKQSSDSLFWGILNPMDSTVFFVSEYRKDINHEDSFPEIKVSSKTFHVEFSNGYRHPMRVHGYEFPELLSNESSVTIRL